MSRFSYEEYSHKADTCPGIVIAIAMSDQLPSCPKLRRIWRNAQ